MARFYCRKSVLIELMLMKSGQILEKYRDVIAETDDLEKIDEILHYKDLERELFKR